MTTPVGIISASDIRTEFGATSGDQNTGPVSLGAYRISQTVSGMSGLSLDKLTLLRRAFTLKDNSSTLNGFVK